MDNKAKRICILEDDDGIREVISMLLTEENYEVLGFGSVGEFFGNIRNHEVDLFLLDVRLPDGNGMEVCTAIKSAQLTKDIPVLMRVPILPLTRYKVPVWQKDLSKNPLIFIVCLKKSATLSKAKRQMVIVDSGLNSKLLSNRLIK